ncbi:uncharacterized protein BT62DRAFT_1071734 [Guyanagaster necrorhizus]|uniref:DUF6534 domain-containing protein n=1 Tax=Guyanagaster necrorhizus TaxID=856835 RepID=A0A9P7W310_9AGAR|nr:uncharacterized protein BT62DRAFT_1071734 [Guyanagaster necrorhizus MCA 3950]KAG7451139.1 hypothetical protein BT62DRAFT_1071734 [Guyanagaster necrorhizus MCA 3950]
MDINDTFGAMLIGALVTMVTYGITTLQAYFYYMTYPQDSNGVKSFVRGLNMDFGHSSRRIYVPCDTLVFGRSANIFIVTRRAYSSQDCWIRKSRLFSGRNMPKVSGICDANLTQLVLDHDQCDNRIPGAMFLHSTDTPVYALEPALLPVFHYGFSVCPEPYKWWMTSVVGSMVFAHFCFGLETVGQFFVRKEFSRLHEVNFVAVLPFGATAILSDILIAIGLCLLLERSRTDFANTNYLIKTLIGYAITRCLLTSLMAVVEVIVFVTKPNSFYSFAIDFVIGKLWSNSLLASLNSRRSLRDTFNRKDSGSMSIGFRVASPELSATGAEPGQISLVRIPRQGESKSSDEESGSCTVSPRRMRHIAYRKE